MRFDPVLQLLKCDYCEKTADPNNLQADIVSPESKIRLDNHNIYEAKIYTCSQCGAELISDDDTAATFCSYCGASVVFDERIVTMRAPKYVIPFKNEKNKCAEIYRKYIKSSIFAPDNMRSDETVDKFRGIYMPYWVYEMDMEGDLHTAGKKSHRSGDYIITDHYDLMSHVRAHSNGTSFDASAAFADELSQSIAPYDFRDCQTFSAGYLSGFYVDTADVDAAVYEKQAKDIFSASIATELLKDPMYRSYSAEPSLDYISGFDKVKKEEMAYFPVWFLANYSKGYISYAVINGQTGKISADIPIDYKKYILGSLLISIPIMLILDFIPFLTIGPRFMAVVAGFFAIIIYFIADRALNQLYTRQHYLDDAGLRSTRHEASPEVMAQNNKSKAIKAVNVGNNIGKIVVFLGVGSLMFGTSVGISMLVLFGFFAMVAGIIVSAASSSKISVSTVKYKRKQLVFKKPYREKVSVLIKPIIAMVLSGLLVLINPYIDSIFYLLVTGVLVLVLTSVWDIVSLHNKLTKRLPKQFGKRGGDESDINF